MLSQAIRPPEPLGDALEDGAAIEGGQDRLGDREELALAADLALERGRLLAQPLGRLGVGHRLGGEARVDDEQPQVVVAGTGGAPASRGRGRRGPRPRRSSAPGASTRRGRPRSPGSCWRAGRWRRPAGSGRCGAAATQPVMPSPSVDLELVRRLVHVLADLALHRDRDEVVADEPVDADVVVVDELAQLGRDGHADVAHAGQVVQPRPELLDRLELGGPRRHPLEVLGGPDRDARLRRQGRRSSRARRRTTGAGWS